VSQIYFERNIFERQPGYSSGLIWLPNLLEALRLARTFFGGIACPGQSLQQSSAVRKPCDCAWPGPFLTNHEGKRIQPPAAEKAAGLRRAVADPHPSLSSFYHLPFSNSGRWVSWVLDPGNQEREKKHAHQPLHQNLPDQKKIWM